MGTSCRFPGNSGFQTLILTENNRHAILFSSSSIETSLQRCVIPPVLFFGQLAAPQIPDCLDELGGSALSNIVYDVGQNQ